MSDIKDEDIVTENEGAVEEHTDTEGPADEPNTDDED